jgi:branched-chain amino acid transport system substrate-binding protein
MAVDEINKAGGISGNEIQLFVEDSAGIPATAVAAMEKLVGWERSWRSSEISEARAPLP